jgi:uncharacterized membrane-anchored protein YhcB (DUF1043 family)
VGQKSIQIRMHIEDERVRLDRNLLEVERHFATTKSRLIAWWHSPALFVVAAFAAGLLLADFLRGPLRRGAATTSKFDPELPDRAELARLPAEASIPSK